MTARRLVLLVVAVVGLVACGDALSLPDRTSESVRAEEARIAQVLEDTEDVWLPGICDVRSLGKHGTTSYVWAYRTDGNSGVSMPLRIDGRQVSAPLDGSLYSVDVRQMFPTELAELILNNDERILP